MKKIITGMTILAAISVNVKGQGVQRRGLLQPQLIINSVFKINFKRKPGKMKLFKFSIVISLVLLVSCAKDTVPAVNRFKKTSVRMVPGRPVKCYGYISLL
ncbi:MAG: hypothetical protein Q8941_18055 [Bacteroidota bacterium]|nr:hypothetical protein [Bacteroidota bacterium]